MPRHAYCKWCHCETWAWNQQERHTNPMIIFYAQLNKENSSYEIRELINYRHARRQWRGIQVNPKLDGFIRNTVVFLFLSICFVSLIGNNFNLQICRRAVGPLNHSVQCSDSMLIKIPFIHPIYRNFSQPLPFCISMACQYKADCSGHRHWRKGVLI